MAHSEEIVNQFKGSSKQAMTVSYEAAGSAYRDNISEIGNQLTMLRHELDVANDNLR